MRIRFVLILVLAPILALGCATGMSKDVNTDKNTQTYTVDINNDGKKETVRVEDKFDTNQRSFISVTNPVKGAQDIESFSVPGKVANISFIDLDNNDEKQMCVFYDNNVVYNIGIFRLMNNKFNNIFSASSECGIEGDFWSTIPRIKVGSFKTSQEQSVSSSKCNWDLWVWSGDQFIKEYGY